MGILRKIRQALKRDTIPHGGVTFEELRRRFVSYANEQGVDKARTLLGEMSVGRLSQLDTTQYATMATKLYKRGY